jgi:MFS family permease
MAQSLEQLIGPRSLRDILAISGSAYVGAYLAFETGMIISRLKGDTYIHKYGAPTVIKYTGIIGSVMWLVTMLIGINIDHINRPAAYVIVLIGYFFAGAGVGPLFPGFLTILGEKAGSEMGTALSRAFLIAMIGVAIIPARLALSLMQPT